MGDILELIFALVVGFFWLFGGALFRQREGDESSQPAAPRQKKQRGGESSSSDPEARQREIREAILRKIQERRQESDSRPVILETKPTYAETAAAPQKEVAEPATSIKSAAEKTKEGEFSWEMEGNPYALEMQKRLQEIEATNRRAAALTKEVRQATQDHYAIDRDKSAKSAQREVALSVGSARSALKNPENVRAAIVYGEILGKPIGLRNPFESRLGG